MEHIATYIEIKLHSYSQIFIHYLRFCIRYKYWRASPLFNTFLSFPLVLSAVLGVNMTGCPGAPERRALLSIGRACQSCEPWVIHHRQMPHGEKVWERMHLRIDSPPYL